MRIVTQLLTGISAVALLLLTGCKKQETTEEAAAFSLSDTMMARCQFYKTKSQTVKNEIRFFGKITADNNREAQVYSIVGGNVTKINVELGDYVKQGDVLATVLSGEVAEFQKEKLDAINDLALAEKNLQVVKDLYAGKLASEKEVTAAERELDKSKAELSRINEVYTIYHLKNGSLYNIIAPISGFIIAKNINQNEQLRGDKSDVLFSIAEISEVWALANVNESEIGKVQLGYDADVKTLSFPDQIYHGQIDKIFNTIDPETKAMKIRVKIPNPDYKLKPEMIATVTIKYNENKQLITIPSSAVIFDKNKYWAMVFKDRHTIETRKIEVYRQIGDSTYIAGGLNENETVVSKNGLFIYDALND